VVLIVVVVLVIPALILHKTKSWWDRQCGLTFLTSFSLNSFSLSSSLSDLEVDEDMIDSWKNSHGEYNLC